MKYCNRLPKEFAVLLFRDLVKLDKSILTQDAGRNYDGSKLATWTLAREFTLLDRFYHAAFGGSFLNHFWLVCACTPVWREAPAEVRAQLDANGMLVKDGQVTPDGFVVNTAFSTYQPYPANVAPDRRVPPQTLPTIGDRLSDARQGLEMGRARKMRNAPSSPASHQLLAGSFGPRRWVSTQP